MREMARGGKKDGIPEQSAKTFLLKMAVVGQYVGQAFAPHGRHRNAVCEAIAFVGMAGVKIETGEKRLTGLWDHVNTGIAQYFLYVVGGKELSVIRAARPFCASSSKTPGSALREPRKKDRMLSNSS